MKRLTTNFLRVFTAAFLMLGFVSMNAQMAFKVISPANLDIEYDIRYAAFGSYGLNQPEALITLVGDTSTTTPSEMCFPSTGDYTGKIALIDRGTCFFALKVRHAQEAGAIGAIICSTDEATVNMASSDGSETITIPAIMLPNSECAPIKAALAAGDVSAQFSFENFQDEVLWDDNGDFSNGLTGWTNTGVTDPAFTWEWGINPQSLGGCQGSYIRSATSENGAMLFDQGFFANGGTSCADGPHYIGELESPIIDASDWDGVALRFWQYNLPISNTNVSSYVAFSTDGGATYADRITVPTFSEQNTAGAQYMNPEKITIFVPEAAGAENFRFKFIYDGTLYAWLLDDIALVEPPKNDVVVENGFFAPLSIVTPASQIVTDTFGFSANLYNRGSVAQDTLDVTASVVNTATGAVAHSETITIQMGPATRDTVSFNGLSLALLPADYVIRYEAFNRGVADENSADNTFEHAFVISDNVFAKENADPANITGSALRSFGDDGWHYGPFYTISSNPNQSSDPLLKNVAMAVAAEDGVLDDEEFLLNLYKWSEPVPNDNYPDFTSELNQEGISPDNHDFFELVALSVVDGSKLNGLADGQLFTVGVEEGDWFDENFEPLTEIALERGATYAILASFSDNTVGLSTVSTIDLPGAPGVLYNWRSADTDIVGRYFTGFNTTSPVVRMTITDFVGTKDQELTTTQVKAFPTLTRDFVNIEMDFETETDVYYTITDSKGSVLQIRDLKETTSTQLQENFNNYASGLYFINVYSAVGEKQIPITVIR